MATVGEVMMRLLPQGTRPGRPGEPTLVDWRLPPNWPPDVFAVAATLVNLSGAYAHASVTGGTADSMDRAASLPRRVARLGARWAALDTGAVIDHLSTLWRDLLNAWPEPVSAPISDRLPAWCSAALELLAIADEASAGIGFGSGPGSALSADVVLRHFSEWAPPELRKRATDTRRITATLCRLVPPEKCCVQPKSRTPQVGCTLRSLSHHLALLPPIGEVTTGYFVSPKPLTGSKLNLLLVPYPYALQPDSLVAGKHHAREGWGRFEVRPRWVPGRAPARITEFLLALVDSARRVSKQKVHGIVLPEMALPRDVADAVADALAPSGLSMFVTGAFARSGAREPGWNGVLTYLFQDHEIVQTWRQAKHHRWKLNETQIEDYRLALDPRYVWWEDIDVANRYVAFCAFHEGATLATLVCEDLARIDPVQPVLRAIGPNLLIALLMDGPQYKARWPGKYATVLADDPGTSVLTVTSTALVDPSIRSYWRRSPQKRAVALWKEASGSTEEIVLEDGHLAVLIGLDLNDGEPEFTMDRRSDSGATTQVALRKNGTWQVPLRSRPTWLTVPPPLATLRR